MTRGFPVGKFGRRNPNRTTVLERNVPLLGRLIEAAHPAKKAIEGGDVAALRIAGSDQVARYLLEKLPQPLAVLEQERCHRIGRPACSGCPIRQMCETWRSKHVEHPSPKASSIVELFCGAGGMSRGFEDAGFRTKLAVDLDIDAIHTYRANRPWMKETEAVCEDIRKLIADGTFAKLRGTVDGVIGGPPCQTFSLVGFRTKKLKDRQGRIHSDQRTWLPIAMAQIIGTIQPHFCVMENVGGFMSALNGDVRRETHETVRKSGYSIIELKVHAEDHGTPQKRTRYMLIGLRNKSVGGTRRAEQLLNDIRSSLGKKNPTPKTVKDALAPLANLPPVPAGGGAEYSTNGNLETWNHYARSHNPRDLAIYKALKPGETAAELEARAPKSIPYSIESFHDKYRKLDPEQPSPTIPAHLKKDANSFIVHGPDRGLTPREAALLQGFPIEYIFIGEQTHQFQQIGNAVPPPVGKVVAQLLKEALEKAKDSSWHHPLMSPSGRRPSERCMAVRERLLADQQNGGVQTVSGYLDWGCKRFQTTKAALKPLLHKELSRVRMVAKAG